MIYIDSLLQTEPKQGYRKTVAKRDPFSNFLADLQTIDR